MASDVKNCITQPHDEVNRLAQRFDLGGISLAFQNGSPGIAKPNLRNTGHVMAQTQRLRGTERQEMKNAAILFLGLAVPGTAAAQNDPLNGEDFVVNCVSNSTSNAVTLTRSGATDKGFIVSDDVKGEAVIIGGLNSLTFLHIKDKDVITFVVDFENLDYDMSIKGPHAARDFGSCGDPVGRVRPDFLR